MKYKIKSDSTCWTTYEIRTPEKGVNAGQPLDFVVAFHANLRQAAESLMDRLIRDGAPEIDLDNVAAVKVVAEAAVSAVREIVAQTVRDAAGGAENGAEVENAN